MTKLILKFCKSNVILSILGSIAILFIIFYYITYDIPELWYNAHILVDIIFQLSLALVASLIFYIFQVYIPMEKNRLAVWPIIEEKINNICEFIETLFSNLAEMYLNQGKKFDCFVNDDMYIILEKYRFNDYIISIGEHHQFFGEISKSYFVEIKKIIDELLTFFSVYLNNEERDALIRIKEDRFYTLLSSQISKIYDITGISDEGAFDEFKALQQKYIKVKEIVNTKGANQQ